jgi:hypothetical protein
MTSGCARWMSAADFARKQVGSNIIRRFALGQILGARVPAGLQPSWPILNFTDFQVTCPGRGSGGTKFKEFELDACARGIFKTRYGM